jgi:23S rRNA (cytidine1920-2'-O)/16S rRNA (cytidine1409-2'-O)-methyltransferase
MVKKRTPKQRIDLLLVQQDLISSRAKAQRLIMAGEVYVNGERIEKPGTRVPIDVELSIAERLRYVGRGGLKLEAALDAFQVSVQGIVAADVGASTGGFTDCLLQRGAARVYSIDVGYGQLAWSIRQDDRVIVMERTNARHLERLPERIELATIDVSFISLKLILPRVRDWLLPEGKAVSLIKPQFEAGRKEVGKGGIVRDPQVHRRVLRHTLEWAQNHNLFPIGLVRSPITGSSGNVEFLALLSKSANASNIDIEKSIDAVLDD